MTKHLFERPWQWPWRPAVKAILKLHRHVPRRFWSIARVGWSVTGYSGQQVDIIIRRRYNWSALCLWLRFCCCRGYYHHCRSDVSPLWWPIMANVDHCFVIVVLVLRRLMTCWWSVYVLYFYITQHCWWLQVIFYPTNFCYWFL